MTIERPPARRLPRPADSCWEAIHAVIDGILDDLDDIALEINDAIFEQLPELDDEELREDLVASTRGNVVLASTLMRDWEDPYGTQPPPEAALWARSLVRHGLPLETLLRVYRVGHAQYWTRFSDALRATTDDPQVVGEAAALCGSFLFAYIDAVLQPLSADFLAEHDRFIRSAEAMRADEVRAILEGTPIDERRSSARLRYELACWHLGFVVWVESGDDDERATASFEAVAQLVAEAVDPSGRLLTCADGRLILAGWIGTASAVPDEVVAALQVDLREHRVVRLAVGESAYGVQGFRDTHDEARVARRVARLSERRPGSITRHAAIRLVALLTADPDRARRFAQRELGPLAAGDELSRRLSATLRTYQEEQFSYARTARRLGIHPNTVAYRIRQVSELLDTADLGSAELRAATALLPMLRSGTA